MPGNKAPDVLQPDLRLVSMGDRVGHDAFLRHFPLKTLSAQSGYLYHSGLIAERGDLILRNGDLHVYRLYP